MRDRMVMGDWTAGRRLPTKLALCREFAVSDATVQRALNLLRSEGFLRSRGCAGTWVTEAPPHVSHIGLVFSGPISQSLFWQLIARETQRLERRDGLRVRIYDRCCYPVGPDHVRLLEDLRARRLAGILTLAPLEDVMDRELATKCGVVRLSFSGKDPYPGGHHVRTLPAPTPVLAYLHAKGRRRLALITTFAQFGGNPGQSQDLVRQAAALGLDIPARFIHPVSVPERYTAAHIMELMMSLPPGDRPDAVYIMDDHLVEQATLGIHNSGVVPGPDAPVEVIAHANFPAPPHAHVSVTFHGYDIRSMAARAVAVVTDSVSGRRPPAQLTWAPVFACDLPYPLP